MSSAKGKHGRTRLWTTDDSDGFKIDPDSLQVCDGILLHFHELRPGDLFKMGPVGGGLFPAPDLMIGGDAHVYLGGGHYIPAANGSVVLHHDHTSGMLVEVVSRGPVTGSKEDGHEGL